jgi:Type II secretion system (T2SS), protein G
MLRLPNMKTWIAFVALAGCGSKEVMDKRDIAKIMTHKLADEAYPSWAMAHPDKACPDKIDELAEYVSDKNVLVDPWGHPYRFYCGASGPPNKGVGAMSFGPDGQEGTVDDVKSWDP